MSIGNGINYYSDTEYAVGDGHPTSADTINRALKELIAKFDNGQADTQVYRNCISIDSPTNITVGVVDDDTVYYDTSTSKWIKATDKAYGIIDVTKQVVYIFGKYTLLTKNDLIAGETYYVDNANPGQYIADNTSGVLVGEAMSTNEILITAVSGGIAIAPPTESPTLASPVTAYEQLSTTLTITNYNATYDYVVTTTNGTATRVGDTITFTSSDLASNLNVTISVTAQNTPIGGAISTPTDAVINVLAIIDDVTDTVGTSDGVLLYTGVTMSEFNANPEEMTNISNGKITTSKVAYNAIAYTGNGTSQDIVNGIEGNLNGRVVDKVGGQVNIKDRTSAYHEQTYSSLIGYGYYISTSQTIAKTSISNGLSKFNTTGFALGASTNVNTNTNTYVSWNNQTTKYTNGYTNRGKFYEVEFNPLTGFFQGVYEGDGTAGHEIPHMMGVAPDYIVCKALDVISNHAVYYGDNLNGMRLNDNLASYSATTYWNSTSPTSSVFTIGTDGDVNSSSSSYYFYGYANTAGKVKVGTYTGTGVVGNAISGLGFNPNKVTIKCTSAVSDWGIKDSKLISATGVDTTVLYPNLSSAEANNGLWNVALGTDEFVLNTAAGVINQAGQTYMYVAIADHEAFETTLYTGNGGTQSITTGLNMDVLLDGGLNPIYPKIPGMLSWNKNRTSPITNVLTDTLIGATNEIYSNDTSALVSGNTTGLNKFNVDGFSFGLSARYNTTANNYINWAWGTTHQYSGVTNHGKPYTCAWNPLSGFVMVKYTGSGVAGHEIPTHIGKSLNLCVVKNLDAIENFPVSYNNTSGRGLYLDNTLAVSTDSRFQVMENEHIKLNSAHISTNVSNNEFIMYGWANSITQEVLEYTGTGLSGNFVKTKKKPAYVMTKRLDLTSNWTIRDNKRIKQNLYANLTNAEGAVGSNIIDFYEDGFALNDNESDTNALNGKYLAFVMYETDEDTLGSKYYG